VEAEPDERLAPGASADDVRAVIEGRGDQVVVVGHQPDCGQVAAALTGGPEPSFPAGGLAVLELE
jgi:phosphohistidine phosphatase SixA